MDMLDFETMMILTKSAAFRKMAPLEFEKWKAAQPEVIDPKHGELVKPLNEDQLSDIRGNIRVHIETKLEDKIGDYLFRNPSPKTTQELGTEKRIEGQGWGHSVVNASPQETEQRWKTFGEAPKKVMRGMLEQIQNEGVAQPFTAAVNNDIREKMQMREHIKAAIEGRTFEGNLTREEEQKLSSAETRRMFQVEDVGREVTKQVRKDINSNELFVYDDGTLGNKKWDGKSAKEMQAEGKLGQPNGGIRGISPSTAGFVPPNTDLPSYGGGGGECCVFNAFGGGGCGPCSKGGSMSILELAFF